MPDVESRISIYGLNMAVSALKPNHQNLTPYFQKISLIHNLLILTKMGTAFQKFPFNNNQKKPTLLNKFVSFRIKYFWFFEHHKVPALWYHY
jgi:hypothetical protein